MKLRSVRFDLLSSEGTTLGSLTISALPKRLEVLNLPVLLDHRDSDSDLEGYEPVQLIEGCEYVYEITGSRSVIIDKNDLFIADNDLGTRGRLRTKLATGRVEVNITLDRVPALPVAFEVRSSKLDYRADYQCMLGDIAQVGAELLLERFAPSEQRLAVDPNLGARTVYQRFVFLRGILQSQTFDAGIRRVLSAPYVEWTRIEQQITPGRGIRSSGTLAYELTRPGPRMEWPGSLSAALATIPQKVRTTRTEETLDNVPNRFVLFALTEWRGLVTQLLAILEGSTRRPGQPESATVRRGLCEGNALADLLDDLIRSPIFEDVGRLSEFPLGNQVLQKKEGYRDILHAYILVQLGASLNWRGGDEVFGGGQRNVATLYEYWVFLELAKIISQLCSEPLDLQSLVTESTEGLNLVLMRKRAHSIRGGFTRRGRRFHVELCFNHQFSRDTNGTWTKSLRPDCSLHLVPHDPPGQDGVWLHFDAKYRVNRVEDLAGGFSDETVNLDDIDKMHTYRDAILNAVGAYVVFPGHQPLAHSQFQEILPGLGAFPLRPSASGQPQGRAAIEHFLDRVFEHVATQTTQHERARYWLRESMRGSYPANAWFFREVSG